MSPRPGRTTRASDWSAPLPPPSLSLSRRPTYPPTSPAASTPRRACAMMDWSRADIVRLIRLIEARPAIWDLSSPLYRDKELRRQCFREVAAELRYPRRDVERKFCNLRTQYGRELTKIARSQVDASTAFPYESKWFAFKLLRFLKQKNQLATPAVVEYVNPAAEKSIDKLPTDAENYVEIKLEGDAESGDAVYEEMEDSSEELILQDDHDSVDQDSLSVRENFPCLVEPTSTQSYVSFNNIQKAKVMSDRRAILPTIQIEKDEYEIFGQCIAAQLRNLKDPYARAKAKFHIQKALFEAETENYKPQNS